MSEYADNSIISIGMKRMTLDKLKVGQSAVVKNINLHGAIRRRLQDLGLISGTTIRCVMKSHHGDLIAFMIRGALIALRNDDTSHILISVKE